MDKFWENLWQTFGFVVAATLVIMILTLLFAPKRVDGYYLGRGYAGKGTCIWAHWTWHPDELVFCTTDTQQAAEFLAKANANIKP